ncbi:hypothetical protein [Burkholderia cenocepacia]|uniref:hypothetical protein n=1 Tax=Burkholderia cenocepacia TaxID=95486 RepID=UPI002AB31462|nr:hypothetical protein [Burkholderia cenocepacia]
MKWNIDRKAARGTASPVSPSPRRDTPDQMADVAADGDFLLYSLLKLDVWHHPRLRINGQSAWDIEKQMKKSC